MESKKNPKVDSGDLQSRSVFVLTGLVLIIASVLCMFEYKKIDELASSIESSLSALEDEEILELSQPDQPPPPPPPPPPPAPPEEVEVLEEDDEREETQEIIIEQEAEVVIVVEEEEDEGPVVEEIFDVVEEMPEFPGGAAKLYEYLGKNIKYPEMAKENGIQGKVFVKFTVMSDGKIKNVEVVRGVHKTLDNEALKVVKEMPKWTPGKQRGKAVNCNFTIPIKFKIS
ncbi:MAG: energy transducer TonB [Crocinitomicaceae bacterium]|nr:energy transducer TonB [Crocinitomicaceae bacterium]|tara:strand:+ start:12040 stop:12723 length:684 start_codon:yes stop_codon:yes gene_type:complete